MSTNQTPRKIVSATEFNAVKHRLAELNAMITVLQRKSRGTTRANAQVAGLQAQVNDIAAQLKAAGERYNNTDDPAIKADAAGQVYALDSRLEELFGDVSGRVATLETRVSGLDGHVATHDTELDMLWEGQTSLHERFTTYVAPRMPRWQVVISLIVGFVAGVIWNNHSFGDSFTAVDGQVFNVPYGPANSVWAAIGAGFIAALIALLVFSFFPNRSTAQATTHKEETIAVPRPSVIRRSARTATPTTEPQPDPTPTQVITTNQGAEVGARS